MIEIIVALFLKFWMFLFGTIRGAISAVPFLRRLLLSGHLESEMQEGQLTLRAGRRDLLLKDIHVLAQHGARITVVANGEQVLAAGGAHAFILPAGSIGCILMAEIIDLSNGRRTHIHRCLKPGDVIEPGANT